MNRTIALVTLSTAAAIATATMMATGAGPAVAAGRVSVTTEHFDAQSSSSPLMLSKTSFVLTDTDIAAGRTIGHDVLYCTDNATDASHCRVAFAQKDGLLYAQFALSDKTGALQGTVTGGTSSYTHATGTLTGAAISPTDVSITLHYRK